MKKRSKPGPKHSLYLGLLLTACAVALIASFFAYRSPEDERALSAEALPPHDMSVAGAESAFQALPASSSTPGSLRIPIFIYHSIRPHIAGEDAENEAYDITPELLDQELTYLEQNGYVAITMDEFVRYVNQGYSPVLRPVILSFDDGWRNQYQYAFPLLKKHHMTGVFYVYTNPIDHQKPHFLTWDMLREMDKAGMEIGSHTVTHPLLYRLNASDMYAEMSQSKVRLEAELGHPVIHFASPFGSTNDLIVATAKTAGYETVRTTYKGIYHTPADLFKLRGILVDDNLNDFITVLKSN